MSFTFFPLHRKAYNFFLLFPTFSTFQYELFLTYVLLSLSLFYLPRHGAGQALHSFFRYISVISNMRKHTRES